MFSVSSGSFSVGYKFRYETDRKPKDTYANFKEEIMNYNHLEKKTIESIIHKVEQFKQTVTAKTTTAKFENDSYTHPRDKMQYDFPEGTPITTDHLMAIILYTDFTQLSSDFSATFRQKNPFETEEQVKKRNNKYWFWSKKLKEVLRAYGQSYYNYGSWDGETGPFFTGVSWIMTLPEFIILLFSPTSTSMQLEVAMKFSGDGFGMILEFNNTDGSAIYTPCFDCSWISRFKEEEERYDTYSFLFISAINNIPYCMYLDSSANLE